MPIFQKSWQMFLSQKKCWGTSLESNSEVHGEVSIGFCRFYEILPVCNCIRVSLPLQAQKRTWNPKTKVWKMFCLSKRLISGSIFVFGGVSLVSTCLLFLLFVDEILSGECLYSVEAWGERFFPKIIWKRSFCSRGGLQEALERVASQGSSKSSERRINHHKHMHTKIYCIYL